MALVIRCAAYLLRHAAAVSEFLGFLWSLFFLGCIGFLWVLGLGFRAVHRDFSAANSCLTRCYCCSAGNTTLTNLLIRNCASTSLVINGTASVVLSAVIFFNNTGQ
jgi:hypothetical protein